MPMAVEGNLWRVLVPCQLLSSLMCPISPCSHRFAGHTLLHHRYQAQVTEDSRGAVGQRRPTTREKK